jgi:tetratricopeptide (TPR) repeat protein
LSQADLAGPGLSASYVSLIEAGKREPTAPVLHALAERLECSVDYLLDGVESADRERVALEMRYAELARRSGEPAEALRRFTALLDDAAVAALGTGPEVALGVARCYEALGRLEDAAERYERLRQLAEDDPRVPTWWNAMLGLCQVHSAIGDTAYSVEVGEAALRRARAAGLSETDLGVQLAVTVAAAYYERGDIGRAGTLLAETTVLAERSGSRLARGSAYWNASGVAYEQGRYGEALTLADRALALYSEGDDDHAQALLRQMRGWLLLRVEPPRPEEALELLEDAKARLELVGRQLDLASCETEIARAHLLLGRPADAVQTALSAIARLRDGNRLERARARVVVAGAQLALGNDDAARQAYEGAATDLSRAGAVRQAAGAWLELAEVCVAMDRPAEALAAYRRASLAAGLRPAPAVPVPQPTLPAAPAAEPSAASSADVERGAGGEPSGKSRGEQPAEESMATER